MNGRTGLFVGLLLLAASTLASEPAPPGLERLHFVRRWGDSRLRHAGSLTSIVPRPDGRRALVTARDGTARIWDLESGLELHRFAAAREGGVWAAALLPGEEKALLTDETHVVLCNVRTGEKEKEFACLEKGSVFRLCLAPDGRRFVACGEHGLVKLWDIAGGAVIRDFSGFSKTVYTAALTPDGALLAAGGEDKCIRVWGTETGVLRHTLAHKEDVYTLQAMPDGRRLASCSGDKTVKMWDLDSGKEIWSAALEGGVKVVALSPDGTRLAGALSKALVVLDAADGKTLQTIPKPEETHWPVAFSANGRKLFSGGDGVLFRYILETGDRDWPPAGEFLVPSDIAHAALSVPLGRILVAEGKVVFAWELRTGQVSPWPQLADRVRGLAVSPDGSRAAVSIGDGTMQILDMTTGRPVPDRQTKMTNYGGEVVFAGARSILASEGEHGKVFDADLRGETGSFGAKGHSIDHVAATADGRIAATAGNDGTVRLWNVATGNELRCMVVAKKEGGNGSTHDRNPQRCAFAPDGRLLLVATRDCRLLAWRAPPETGDELKPEVLQQWIAELGADEFDVREQATERLVAAGEMVLPLLDAVDARDNAEVEARMKIVRKRMAVRGVPVVAAGDLAVGRPVCDVVVLPDNRHWVAAAGAGALGELVVGESAGGALRILRRIPDGSGPARVFVSPDGATVHTLNRDGTMSVYAIGE
jgi:WD40 repeat protein